MQLAVWHSVQHMTKFGKKSLYLPFSLTKTKCTNSYNPLPILGPIKQLLMHMVL